MKQHTLDLSTPTPRRKPAGERLIELLRDGPKCRWVIVAELKISDVSGAVDRANRMLVGSGTRIENLAGDGETGRYAIVKDRDGPGREE